MLKMAKDLKLGDVIVEGGDQYEVVRVTPRGSTYVYITVIKDGETTRLPAYGVASVEVA